MKRGDFLKGVGLAGIGTLVPFGKVWADNGAAERTTASCTLIPSETEGPYPLDLSATSSMFRTDITEGKTGVPLDLTLTIVNINDSCNPVVNARVDIWHCDKDGYYSGYSNNGYLGTQDNTGKTFCRGIQITDTAGQVKFETIYPGWYTGRVTHIHFQVFLSSVLKATSQLAFPDTINDSVYTTSSLYATHGKNTSVASNAADSIFADMSNTAYEMLTVVPNTTTGGYSASLTVGIAVPATGVINLEPETGGQFSLGAGFPNPFTDVCTIPYTLNNNAHVRLELFDLSGRKVATLLDEYKTSGAYNCRVEKGGLAAGSYAYQMTTENEAGSYRQSKLLTIQ